jgi:hypothetical protein
MRRIAIMMAGAVLALPLAGPAAAGATGLRPAPAHESMAPSPSDRPPAPAPGSEPGQGRQAQPSPVAGEGEAHYDKQHHDNPGENNCNRYRDQCHYDPRCDCYYRMSQPPTSDSPPADQTDRPAPAEGHDQPKPS